jgi:hypothetical protein
MSDDEFLTLLRNNNILKIVDNSIIQNNKSEDYVPSIKFNKKKRKTKILMRSPYVVNKKESGINKTLELQKLLSHSSDILSKHMILLNPGPNRIYNSNEIELKRMISTLKFNITKIKRLFNFK